MIEVKHLTKNYGRHTAVSDLSFTVEKGQIYGFLGPNGAGKTTTMSIMTGCLAATSGEVKIDGHDIFEDAQEAKKLIGYLPEQPPLYLDRTPREYLTFVGRAKGVPAAELGKQIQRIMHITQIEDMQDRLIKNLSKGYRQRVGIAQALMGNPEVIILDEPDRWPGPAPDYRNPRADRQAGQRAHGDPLQPYPVGGAGHLPDHPDHLQRQAGRLRYTPKIWKACLRAHPRLPFTADATQSEMATILDAVTPRHGGGIQPRPDGTRHRQNQKRTRPRRSAAACSSRLPSRKRPSRS